LTNDPLGVKVYVHPDTQEPGIIQVETDTEWLSIDEVTEMSGIDPGSLYRNIHKGSLKAEHRGKRQTVIHRSEVMKYLVLCQSVIDG
jgi:excisionase family DNA binding protein